MAKDIELKPDEYEIVPSEPKNLDEPDKKKFNDIFGNSMLFAGIGVLLLGYLLIKKKK